MNISDKATDSITSQLMDGKSFNLPDGYHFVDENGNKIEALKIALEKDVKEYPKTYEECCEIIHSDPKFYVDTHLYSGILETLYKLLICRDAYLKLYSEENGLEKPWSPDRCTVVYGIGREEGCVIKYDDCWGGACVLEFPTRKLRDMFYENFKIDIERCKELL
jgi:hypothetical protein